MLHIVGLGLGDLTDVTVKGRLLIETASEVVLEHYTSILSGVSVSDYEQFFGRPIVLADRDFVEGRQIEELISRAKTAEICFLVVGDPFCATTHTDLVLRARTLQVPVNVVHNASIMSAIGCSGLQVYRFGETISVPLLKDNWQPDSFYAKLHENFSRNLHTLCLLDIKVKERSEEGMMRGKDLFEPPRYMTVLQAVEQLHHIEQTQQLKCFADDVNLVALARVGKPDQTILFGSVRQFRDSSIAADALGGPLHSLLVCAPELHDLEREFLRHFQLSL